MNKEIGIIDNLLLVSTPEAPRAWAKQYKAGFKQFFEKRSEDLLKPMPLEQYIEMMEKYGIEKAHIIGATKAFSENPISGGRADYEKMGKIIEKYPNKFVGSVICDVRLGMPEVKDIERIIKEFNELHNINLYRLEQ